MEEKVTTQKEKNPGRVEAGKKLAQRNKEQKEKLLENSKVKNNPDYINWGLGIAKGLGAFAVVGVVVVVGKKYFSTKKAPDESPKKEVALQKEPKKTFNEF